MLRRAIIVAFGLLLFAPSSFVRASERPLPSYREVHIAPSKTSIYIGSVSLTMPALERNGSTYSSTYAAKVFPFFFESEDGKLSIDIPEEDLRRLERGEVIQFTGRGKNNDGQERRIEGRAIPEDSDSGKIKVRVFVSKKIQLIFNTTYQFPVLK